MNENSEVLTVLFELHKQQLEFQRDTAKLILNRLNAIEQRLINNESSINDENQPAPF